MVPVVCRFDVLCFLLHFYVVNLKCEVFSSVNGSVSSPEADQKSAAGGTTSDASFLRGERHLV